MHRSILVSFLLVLPIFTASSLLTPGKAFASRLAPLHLWWSPGREDNFATTQQNWRGSPGETRSPDYQWVGVIGYVADPLSSQPPDTVPIYSWYSPGRGDNFLTSQEVWRPRSAADRTRSPDYQNPRLEGYVYTRPLAGTLPLQGHWSPGRGDNFTTTQGSWIGNVGDRHSPDYELFHTSGYVVAPKATDLKPGDRDVFRIGKALNGQRKNTSVEGIRPLLFLLFEHDDVRLRHSPSYYESRFFDDPATGIPAYFREMSKGRFTWRKAGVIGPDVPPAI
jgi:hypothetical protein